MRSIVIKKLLMSAARIYATCTRARQGLVMIDAVRWGKRVHSLSICAMRARSVSARARLLMPNQASQILRYRHELATASMRSPVTTGLSGVPRPHSRDLGGRLVLGLPLWSTSHRLLFPRQFRSAGISMRRLRRFRISRCIRRRIRGRQNRPSRRIHIAASTRPPKA